MPISLGIVSRAIANAQTQVEGYNFDIRKHLIDYDDVLNTQREVIYEQRKRILTKPDLRDDVWAMVEAELQEHIDPLFATDESIGGDQRSDADRVSAALRLVHYLETVQPVTAVSEGALFPSFALQHVLSTLPLEDTPETLRAALLRNLCAACWTASQRAGRQSIERTVLRSLESEPESIERFLEAATMAYEERRAGSRRSGSAMLDALRAAQAIAQSTGLELDTRELRGLEGRQLERARDGPGPRTRSDTGAHPPARPGPGSHERALESPRDPCSPSTPRQRRACRPCSPPFSTVSPTPWRRDRPACCTRSRARSKPRFAAPMTARRASVTHFLHEARFGTQSGYDKQHRRVNRRVERLQYSPWVAEQIAGWDREPLEQAILDHLRCRTPRLGKRVGRQRTAAHRLQHTGGPGSRDTRRAFKRSWENAL